MTKIFPRFAFYIKSSFYLLIFFFIMADEGPVASASQIPYAEGKIYPCHVGIGTVEENQGSGYQLCRHRETGEACNPGENLCLCSNLISSNQDNIMLTSYQQAIPFQFFNLSVSNGESGALNPQPIYSQALISPAIVGTFSTLPVGLQTYNLNHPLWGTTIIQHNPHTGVGNLKINLSSEIYNAAYFVDICYVGPITNPKMPSVVLDGNISFMVKLDVSDGGRAVDYLREAQLQITQITRCQSFPQGQLDTLPQGPSVFPNWRGEVIHFQARNMPLQHHCGFRWIFQETSGKYRPNRVTSTKVRFQVDLHENIKLQNANPTSATPTTTTTNGHDGQIRFP